MDEIRRQLLEKAIEVAALLAVVEDDDERRALQLDFERSFHDELYMVSR